MNRRTLMLGASALAALTACGDSSKFIAYGGPQVTQVQVFKSQRKMYLMHGDKVLEHYKISLGGDPIGPKRFEGDGKTPEGLYYINRRNPNSAYYLSIGISYPNPEQVTFAAEQGKKAGGDIFIHGRDGKNKGRGRDWTAGCIAVKDKEVREIYAMVQDGTPIFIFP
ncbi:L,D-transpeptidase family protein [Thioclava sp.]|uniref:L,D-transpeptidase family protein n=1 Tax=Thioclava sp. TaxID=1933450 RepID=UPI003AA81C5F